MFEGTPPTVTAPKVAAPQNCTVPFVPYTPYTPQTIGTSWTLTTTMTRAEKAEVVLAVLLGMVSGSQNVECVEADEVGLILLDGIASFGIPSGMQFDEIVNELYALVGCPRGRPLR